MPLRPGEGIIVTQDGIEPLPGCAYPAHGEAVVTRGEVDDLRARVTALEAIIAEIAATPGGTEIVAAVIKRVTERA